jgi:hypothetical protein
MTRRARDYLLSLEELRDLRTMGRGNTLRATELETWLTEAERGMDRGEWEAIYARLADRGDTLG